MTTYHYDEVIVWVGLGGDVRGASGVRSISVIDPATGLAPTLTQGGVTVAYLTSSTNGRATFTATSDVVVHDFGAGPVAAYSTERLAAAVTSGVSDAGVDAKIATQHTADDIAYAPIAGSANYGTVVNHGNNPQVARPATTAPVYWVGTARPVFALDGDLLNSRNTGTLQVRAEGIWTPPAFDPIADITWHSAMWADAIPGVATGAKLSTVPDASGNGHDWAQPTSSAQPLFLAKKFNGRAAVYFDGTTKGLLGPTLPAGIPAPFSFYAVAYQGNASSRVVTYQGASAPYTGIGVSGAGLVFTGATPSLLGAARTSTFQRIAAIADTSGLIRVNGADVTGAVGSAPILQLSIGSEPALGAPLNGYVAFVGFKVGRFTPAEIVSLDAWALAYYGIAGVNTAANEAWSWWTRPRAVAAGGKTYVGATGLTGATLNVYSGTSDKPTKYQLSTSVVVDDHNNPALIVQPGKPLVAMYSLHGGDSLLRWRKSAVNIEQGISFGSERTFTLAGSTTYAVAHIHGNNIYVFHRCPATTGWSLLKSTDWAETWTDVQVVSSAFQFYGASVRYGADTLRLTMTNHPVNLSPPDQNIYYAEINLATGSITKSDGTVLGNLSGTNLPLALGSLELIASPPAGQSTWAYDVSDSAIPEVLWSSFDKANIATTGVYKYTKLVAGVWVTEDIVAAGATFTASAEPYLGGAQFAVGGTQGQVFVTREAAGTWYIEKRTTTDGGITWATTVVESSATTKLARAWPTERRDATVTWPVFVDDMTRHTTYVDFDNTIRPAGTAS